MLYLQSVDADFIAVGKNYPCESRWNGIKAVFGELETKETVTEDLGYAKNHWLGSDIFGAKLGSWWQLTTKYHYQLMQCVSAELIKFTMMNDFDFSDEFIINAVEDITADNLNTVAEVLFSSNPKISYLVFLPNLIMSLIKNDGVKDYYILPVYNLKTKSITMALKVKISDMRFAKSLMAKIALTFNPDSYSVDGLFKDYKLLSFV